jgi:hypothetical protein
LDQFTGGTTYVQQQQQQQQQTQQQQQQTQGQTTSTVEGTGALGTTGGGTGEVLTYSGTVAGPLLNFYGGSFATGGAFSGSVGGTGSGASVPVFLGTTGDTGLGIYSTQTAYQEPSLMIGVSLMGTSGTGAFKGYLAGVWSNYAVEQAKALAIYINANQNAGYLYSDTIRGTYDPSVHTWQAQGSLAAAGMATTSIPASSLATSLTSGTLSGGVGGSFGGSGVFSSLSGHWITQGLNDQNWGIWSMWMGGFYHPPTGTTLSGKAGGTITLGTGTGYWIGDFQSGDWGSPTSNRFSASLTNGTFLTTASFGNISTAYGGILGTYDTFFDAWQAAGVGVYENVTPLKFSGSLSMGLYRYFYVSSTYPGLYSSNSVAGLFGSIASPFATPGVPVGFHLMGTGTAPSSSDGRTWTAHISGSDYVDTTSQYTGWIGGITRSDNTITGYLKAIYKDSSNNIGILTGGFPTGTHSPQVNMWKAEGVLLADQRATGYSTSLWDNGILIGGAPDGLLSGSITDGGAITTQGTIQAMASTISPLGPKTVYISDMPWGIYALTLGGTHTYSGTQTSAFTLDVGGTNWKSSSDFWLARIAGNWNADHTIDGSLSTGNYLTPTAYGTITGNMVGSWNPSGTKTWDGFVTGEFSEARLAFGSSFTADLFRSQSGTYTEADYHKWLTLTTDLKYNYGLFQGAGMGFGSKETSPAFYAYLPDGTWVQVTDTPVPAFIGSGTWTTPLSGLVAPPTDNQYVPESLRVAATASIEARTADQFTGIMGGLQLPWTNNYQTDARFMGKYIPSDNDYTTYSLFRTQVGGTMVDTLGTVRGAYAGFVGGVIGPYLYGAVNTIYIGNDNTQAGMLWGGLFGTVYPGVNMWSSSQTLIASPFNNNWKASDSYNVYGITQDNLSSNLVYGDMIGDVRGVFTYPQAGGYVSGHGFGQTISIKGQDWGALQLMTGLLGDYNNPAGASISSNSTFYLGGYGEFGLVKGTTTKDAGYWLLNQGASQGTQPGASWMYGLIQGNADGAFLTMTKAGMVATSITGAYGGVAGGSINAGLPSQGWQAQVGGYWQKSYDLTFASYVKGDLQRVTQNHYGNYTRPGDGSGFWYNYFPDANGGSYTIVDNTAGTTTKGEYGVRWDGVKEEKHFTYNTATNVINTSSYGSGTYTTLSDTTFTDQLTALGYTGFSSGSPSTDVLMQQRGDFNVILGGIDNLWNATSSIPAGLYLLGEYSTWPGDVLLPSVFAQSLASYNVKYGTYTTLDGTADKGAYYGYMAGRTVGTGIEGRIYALYVDPGVTNQASILKGTFTGTLYPEVEMWAGTGSMYPMTSPGAIVDMLPHDLINNIWEKAHLPSVHNLRTDYGGTFSMSTMAIADSVNHVAQPWGVYSQLLSGNFSSLPSSFSMRMAGEGISFGAFGLDTWKAGKYTYANDGEYRWSYETTVNYGEAAYIRPDSGTRYTIMYHPDGTTVQRNYAWGNPYGFSGGNYWYYTGLTHPSNWGAGRTLNNTALQGIVTTAPDSLNTTSSTGPFAGAGDRGYMLGAIGGSWGASTWSGGGTMDASMLANFIAKTKMGSLTGDFLGTYDTTTNTWQAAGAGYFSGTPLTFLNWVENEFLYYTGSGWSTDLVGSAVSSIHAWMGGTDPLFSHGPVNVSVLGEYYKGNQNAHTFRMETGSYNYLNYGRTTYEGGAYYGFMAGIEQTGAASSTGSIEAMIAALYIDPSGNAGVIRNVGTGGHGTLTGITYPTLLSFAMTGQVQAFQKVNSLGISVSADSLVGDTLTPGNRWTDYVYSPPQNMRFQTDLYQQGSQVGSSQGSLSAAAMTIADYTNKVVQPWGISAQRGAGQYSSTGTPDTGYFWAAGEGAPFGAYGLDSKYGGKADYTDGGQYRYGYDTTLMYGDAVYMRPSLNQRTSYRYLPDGTYTYRQYLYGNPYGLSGGNYWYYTGSGTGQWSTTPTPSALVSLLSTVPDSAYITSGSQKSGPGYSDRGYFIESATATWGSNFNSVYADNSGGNLLSGLFMTRTKMGGISWQMLGTYDSSTWQFVTAGVYDGTPLNFVSSFGANLLYYDGTGLVKDSALGPTASIGGLLGGTEVVWSGTPTVTYMGEYYPGSQQAYVWRGEIGSYDYTTESTIAHGGGAYHGYLGGTAVQNQFNALLAAIYIDPSGHAGTLTGSLTGMGWPTLFSVYMSGQLQVTDITQANIGLSLDTLPTNLWKRDTAFPVQNLLVQGGFDAGVTGSLSGTHLTSSMAIVDSIGGTAQPWGVYGQALYGSYNIASGTPTTFSFGVHGEGVALGAYGLTALSGGSYNYSSGGEYRYSFSNTLAMGESYYADPTVPVRSHTWYFTDGTKITRTYGWGDPYGRGSNYWYYAGTTSGTWAVAGPSRATLVSLLTTNLSTLAPLTPSSGASDRGFIQTGVNGTWGADGSMIGTQTGGFITRTTTGLVSGNLLGTYDSGANTWQAVTAGTWIGAPLSFVSGVSQEFQYYDGTFHNRDMLSGGYPAVGSINGLFGGTAPFYSGSAVNVTMMGEYYPGMALSHTWGGLISSYDYANYTVTAAGGGSYYGYLGGVERVGYGTGGASASLEALLAALYIDPNGHAGVLMSTGGVRGTLTGGGYRDLFSFSLQGQLQATEIATSDIRILPENLPASIYDGKFGGPARNALFSGTGGAGTLIGSASGSALFITDLSAVTENWGVYGANLYGAFNAGTGTDFSAVQGGRGTFGLFGMSSLSHGRYGYADQGYYAYNIYTGNRADVWYRNPTTGLGFDKTYYPSGTVSIWNYAYGDPYSYKFNYWYFTGRTQTTWSGSLLGQVTNEVVLPSGYTTSSSGNGAMDTGHFIIHTAGTGQNGGLSGTQTGSFITWTQLGTMSGDLLGTYNQTATWATESSGTTSQLRGTTYGNGKFVAVGLSGTIRTSSDGVTWATQTSGTSQSLNCATYANNEFVVVGDNGTILTSPNGTNWTTLTLGTSVSLGGTAYGNSKFVTVGQSGAVFTSPDGVYWTPQTSGTGQWLLAATYGNGKFVAVGNSGTILTSLDGITWATQTPGPTRLTGATYGNGLFVAVGDNGTILTSPNGVTWTQRTSGTTTEGLLGATYGNGKFVVVGWNGDVFTSSDGVNWATQTSGTSNPLLAATYGNGQFVAVGMSGAILTGNQVWQAVNTGQWVGTDLTFRSGFPLVPFSPVVAPTYFNGTALTADGNMRGAFGGTTSLWGTQPVPVTMIGEYEPGTPGINGHIWHATVNSGNLVNNTATTFDGGAYNGFIGGSILRNATTGNDDMDTRFLALYIEPGTTSPYKTGILKSSLTGTGYPQSLTFEQYGPTIQKIELGSTTVTPANLYSFSNPVTWSGNTSFIFNNYEMGSSFGRPYDYAKDTMTLGGTDWSLYKARVGGSYSGIAIPGSPFLWNTTDLTGSPYTGYGNRDITVTWAANGKITGTGFTYGAQVVGPTTTPSTSWIGVGDLVGTFDANATVFQAVWLGLSLETNRFLEMAETLAGRQTLGQLNIPAYEVGIIPTMSGIAGTAGGYSDYINLSIQNMRFFASQPGSGTPPQFWASGPTIAHPTDGVSGTYSGNPLNLAPFSIGGSGFGALFTVQNWNAGTGGNKWMGTITNGAGALTINGAQGLYPGNITFKGAAAGTHTTWTPGPGSYGSFSGNAAGTVKVP